MLPRSWNSKLSRSGALSKRPRVARQGQAPNIEDEDDATEDEDDLRWVAGTVSPSRSFQAIPARFSLQKHTQPQLEIHIRSCLGDLCASVVKYRCRFESPGLPATVGAHPANAKHIRRAQGSPTLSKPKARRTGWHPEPLKNPKI